MYILGAAILASSFIFAEGQMFNGTRIVFVEILKHLYGQSRSPLETLIDIDLHSIETTCADMNIDDCSAMVLRMYNEAAE